MGGCARDFPHNPRMEKLSLHFGKTSIRTEPLTRNSCLSARRRAGLLFDSVFRTASRSMGVSRIQKPLVHPKPSRILNTRALYKGPLVLRISLPDAASRFALSRIAATLVVPRELYCSPFAAVSIRSAQLAAICDCLCCSSA